MPVGAQPSRSLRVGDIRAAGIMLVVIAAGIGGGWRAGHQTDRHMRTTLLQEARLAAEAVNLTLLDQLTGSPADLENPAYRRLKDQLTVLKQARADYAFLYVLGRDAKGQVFFFADSEPPDSPDCSPAGQPYEEATPELRSVFSERRGVTEGPVTDRWGTFVSALVPLADPRSGVVRAVVGLDIVDRTWTWKIAAATFPSVLATVAMASLLAAGRILRRRLNAARHPGNLWFLPLEVSQVAAAGLILTAFFAWTHHREEAQIRSTAFDQLAASQTSPAAELWNQLGHSELESLAGFFEGSQAVDQGEFERFAGYLSRNPAVGLWGWVEAGADGKRPLLLLQPPAGHPSLAGKDLASDPQCRAAMEEAEATGLPSATGILAAGQSASVVSHSWVCNRPGWLLLSPYVEPSRIAEGTPRRS